MFLYTASETMMTTTHLTKKYTPFILLIIAFILPIVISWLLYYNHEHFSLKTTNHGVLVNPPMDVKNLWRDHDSKKWQIVYVPNHVCDTDCENVVYTLNQIKKALGKDSQRVDIKKISFSEPHISAQKQSFVNEKFSIENKVYLVDPAGNLFMYYADSSNPMNILKDLKHVLEVSQIG